MVKEWGRVGCIHIAYACPFVGYICTVCIDVYTRTHTDTHQTIPSATLFEEEEIE